MNEITWELLNLRRVFFAPEVDRMLYKVLNHASVCAGWNRLPVCMILYVVSVVILEEYTPWFLLFIVHYFNLKPVYLTAFIVYCFIFDNSSS